jgi:hypothetical protein
MDNINYSNADSDEIAPTIYQSFVLDEEFTAR